jgi:hypothetical protein
MTAMEEEPSFNRQLYQAAEMPEADLVNLTSRANAAVEEASAEQLHSRALMQAARRIELPKALPDDCRTLATDPRFMSLVREAYNQVNHEKPSKKAALQLAKQLGDHWLHETFEILKQDPCHALAVAHMKFGFLAAEDPDLSRLEAIYQFHSGVITMIFDICSRASILFLAKPASVESTNVNGRQSGKGKGRSAGSKSKVAGGAGFSPNRKRPRSKSQLSDTESALPDADTNEPPLNEVNVDASDWHKECQLVTNRLYKSIELCYYMYEMLHLSFRVFLASCDTEPVHMPVNEFDIMRFSHLRVEDFVDYQSLLIVLGRHFRHRAFRRSKDRICTQVKITFNGRQYHSHYWKPGKRIESVISKFCDKDTHSKAWADSTKSANNFKNAVEYFKSDRDSYLPRVKCHRRTFTFLNGILVLGTTLPGYAGPGELGTMIRTAPAKTPATSDVSDPFADATSTLQGFGRFFLFDGPAPFTTDHIPEGVHSCRMFDYEFPNEIASALNDGEDMETWLQHRTPASIDAVDREPMATLFPTPLFDKLFQLQGFDFYDSPWNPLVSTPLVYGPLFTIYGMLGRLLYAVGECDNFQVAIFFMGLAGTGKSLICDVITSLYDKAVVGRMSANTQETFALAPFVKSLLVIISEVKHNIKLASCDFQSMVTGEGITANVKNKDAVTIDKWRSHLLMAGNEVPGWADALGALFRRLFCIEMNVCIDDAKVDTTLFQRIMDTEVVNILIKLHTCYRVMVAQHPSQSFWQFAPSQFQEARKKLEQELNAAKKFILTGDTIARDTPQARADAARHYERLEPNEPARLDFTMYISYQALFILCTSWCRAQGIEVRAAGGNRDVHNKKILTDLGYKVIAMSLISASGAQVPKAAEYVLGLTEEGNPLLLPNNWRQLIPAPAPSTT